MKNFEEFDKMIDLIISNKIPGNFGHDTFILFMNGKQKRETDIFLKNLGSSGSVWVNLPNTDMKCDHIVYGGYKFYIVDTGYWDKEPHIHDWKESKTYFKEKKDDVVDANTYILSRYCQNCGKTETYHGTDKRWVETGYIKVCKPDR